MGLSAGMRLGPYEILAPLGAGGMGEVYRAKDTRLGREVAVKVLPEEVAGNAKALSRFQSEARAVAALSHPNILALFDVGEAGGVRFAVSELLQGQNLRLALADGPLSVRSTLKIAGQIANALAAAHENGIVHRDVKPENVFLIPDGHAKLLDFGLARHVRPPGAANDTRSPTVTNSSSPGSVTGTVAYMSPEQARGDAVDFRGDQFSLGVVLYEMLAGTRPFQAASVPETLTAIIRDEPRPLKQLAPHVRPPVQWIVERLLTKEPQGRYDSTGDLARDLATCLSHLSDAVSATDVGPGEGPRLERRISIGALATIAALAATLGLFAGMRFVRTGAPSGSPLSLSLSFPVDAAPDTASQSPFALTPDGKTLVYAGRKLFVRRLDRDESRPIPGSDGAYFPFISPDGLQVGFFADGKLRKAALAGGLPVTLCDAPNGRGGSWGADGTIVFAPNSKSGLQCIPASGGESRVVTTADPASLESHRSPYFLPDGEHVLFQIMNGNRPSRSAVVSLRTGERRILVEDAAYPRYLPTGHLVFTRPGSLFAVPFSPERLETSGPPVPLLDDLVTNYAGMRCAEMTFSGDGTLVYLPDRQYQRTLVWVDRKGAVERIPFPPGGYQEVALSPDGAKLAAIAVGKGERMALFFGDFGRGTLSRSTAEGLFQGLAWSPDGRRVAFGFAPEEEAWTWQVFLQSGDGSTPPERLTGSSGMRQEEPTCFAPDGSLLALSVFHLGGTTVANTGWDIFVLPLSGEGTQRPFVQTKFTEGDAHFSPDGRWVSYHSTESGRLEVFARPFSGASVKWQISTEGGSGPRWSRSGRELFYQQGARIMSVDVEMKPTFRVSRPRTLFESPHYGSHDAYDVAPDGTRFLMIKEDPAESGPAHVRVVLNWFEEVNRRVPGAR